MTKPEEYEAIRWWHERTGSLGYYIQALQEKAAAAQAPIDAIFLSASSYFDAEPRRWVTLSECTWDAPKQFSLWKEQRDSFKREASK